jgi:hypothetical protein
LTADYYTSHPSYLRFGLQHLKGSEIFTADEKGVFSVVKTTQFQIVHTRLGHILKVFVVRHIQ